MQKKHSKQSPHLEIVSSHTAGKVMPHDLAVEEAVLGACLVDKVGASQAITFLRGANVFYNQNHLIIWAKIIELESKNVPIDILTVYNHLKKDTTIQLDVLINLTSKVASSAHIEAHCMILYELYMRRTGIQEASNILSKCYDLSQDIFKTYDYSFAALKAVDPSNIFETNTLIADIIRGTKEPYRAKLCGDFVRQGELALFFGDEGCGKSMFSFQMGKAISEGKPMFDIPGFENESTEVKTMIFDFELSRQNLAERYHNQGTFESFNENYIRVALNRDSTDGSVSSSRIVDTIVSHIETHKPGFVIIDNITWIVDEVTDNSIAKRLMQKLMSLVRNNFPLSILVIGHTPKRDKTQPIESKHFAGGKNLSNFCTSQFAIVKSLKDPGIKYVKQLKTRSSLLMFDGDNVCEFEIPYNPDGTLKFVHLGNGLENDHIRYLTQTEKTEQIDDLIYDLNEKNYSLSKIVQEIKKNFGESISKSTIHRKISSMKSKEISEKAAQREEELDF